jgi:hypothetical protein
MFLICCSIIITTPKMFLDLRWHSCSTLNHFKWRRNEKAMNFESKRGPNRRKNKNVFCKYESYFSTLIGYSSFLVPKQTLGQRKLNLWTFSSINSSKVLIMFALVSYFRLNFNYIIFIIFWLGSTRFLIRFQLCLLIMYTVSQWCVPFLFII